MSIPKAPAGAFTVLYFAFASSHTGKSHDFLPAPLKITELYDVLDKKYPGFQQKVLESSAVTVNLEYVDMDEENAKGEDCMVIEARDECLRCGNHYFQTPWLSDPVDARPPTLPG